MSKEDRKSKGKIWTRREFLKIAGATTGAVGATLGFPPILKYALGETPIKICVPAALSGTVAILGTDFRDASILPMEQVNAEGGILGRKVKIVVRDTAGTAAGASTRAKEMIESDKVDFILLIGAWSIGACLLFGACCLVLLPHNEYSVIFPATILS